MRNYLDQRSNFPYQFGCRIEIFQVIRISQECGLKQVIADTTLAVSSEMGAILLKKCPQNRERHSGGKQERKKNLELKFCFGKCGKS
jgi:hypothetical protein